MAYNEPSWWFRSLLNPMAKALKAGGTVTLRVPRRSSGGVQAIPVVPVEQDGHRYVVRTRGETEWVRNLRAAGRAEVVTRGRTEPVVATEVPVDRRSSILAAYRSNGGRTVARYFQQLPDDVDHPVFAVHPDA